MLLSGGVYASGVLTLMAGPTGPYLDGVPCHKKEKKKKKKSVCIIFFWDHYYYYYYYYYFLRGWLIYL